MNPIKHLISKQHWYDTPSQPASTGFFYRNAVLSIAITVGNLKRLNWISVITYRLRNLFLELCNRGG